MLTSKQEKFTLNLFKDMPQYEAWGNAGYSTKYPKKIISENACRLANKSKIKARLKELRAEASKHDVADFSERQKILSEIARGNLIDYQELGADGGYLNIGKESPNTRAISEITTTTKEDNTLISKVKLHNPVPAIDLLNKMDRLYSEAVESLNDNRVINFILTNRESQNLIEGITERLGNKIEGEIIDG